MLRLVSLALLVALVACAYPRRSTSLSSVANPDDLRAPSDIVRIRFASAIIPPTQRSGQPWDEDGSGPDSFIRMYRGDALIFESAAVADSIQPRFDLTTENVSLPPGAEIRLELWEQDTARLPTPIGTWRGRGLPAGALEDADASLMLEGRATLLFRVLPPVAERGTGIALYEFRSDHVKVLEVIPASPAGRAGLRVGDDIVAIGGEPLDGMDEGSAASALSLASSRSSRMTVRRGTATEELTLDSGYVWRAR